MSSLFSNQQLDLGLIQCHPEPSILALNILFRVPSYFQFVKYDLTNSARLFWQPADVGLPVWSWAIPVSPETTDLAPTILALPLFLLYSTFFFQTHLLRLSRLFLHGTICSAPTNLAVSPGGVTAACFAIISDNILQPLFVRQVLTGISFPPIGRKNDIFEYFKLNRWKDAVDAVDACRGASRPFE